MVWEGSVLKAVGASWRNHVPEELLTSWVPRKQKAGQEGTGTDGPTSVNPPLPASFHLPGSSNSHAPSAPSTTED